MSVMPDRVRSSSASKARGKPIVMGSPTTLIEVARLPELSLLTQSSAPVRLMANMNSDLHTFRMGNGDKLDWVGTRLPEGQSRNAAYVLFDRGQYFECYSVSDFYELIPATEDKVGEEEIDVISKRLKIMKAKEAAAAQRVASNIAAEEAEEGDGNGDATGYKKRRRRDSEESMMTMPVNDLKVRKQVAKKKKAKDLDGQAQAQSSTALGDVRKAEVDWDYEEGVASDDEEGAALSNDEVEDKREEDVDDSEDEDKVLTNYGESLSKMLQNQKRAQADQELQAYSDDDDDDEEGNPNAAAQNAAKNANASKMLARAQVPGTSQVQTEERVREDLLNLLRSKENVTIKMILVELGVSARNQKFQLIKNLITELCDIVTTTVDGEQVRYIKIKS